LALVVGVILAVAGCGSKSPKAAAPSAPTNSTAANGRQQSGPDTPAPKLLAQKTTVTIALPVQSESYLPMEVGKELGEFAKENIDLNITTLPIPDSTVLLAQGKIDMVTGFFVTTFNAQAGGAKIKLFAPLGAFAPAGKAGLWVRKDLADAAGTVDPCSLKGKTISFGGSAGLGATSSWWIQQWMSTCKTGASVKDVRVSTLGGGDEVTALQSGAIDGGALYDPNWNDPATKGYALLAVPNYKGVLGGYMYGPSLSGKPEVLDAVVRALLRTTRTYLQGNYKTNPDVVAASIKELGVSAATFTATPPLVFDPNMNWDTSVVTSVQQTWTSIGGLLTYSKPLSVDQVYDDSYVKSVLAE
jgi:NitT/TauT family transport system substrate-binding protein